MPAANPMRGEVPLGDNKLIVSFNTICALEEVTGRRVLDLMADLQLGLGLSDIRLWVKTFLDKPMTLDEVGDWLGEVGIEPATTALVRGFELFFPAPRKGKDKNPPKAE